MPQGEQPAKASPWGRPGQEQRGCSCACCLPPQGLRDTAPTPQPRNPALCWPLPGEPSMELVWGERAWGLEWINKQRKNRGEQAGGLSLCHQRSLAWGYSF